jgi:kinesin family protein C2/C3
VTGYLVKIMGSGASTKKQETKNTSLEPTTVQQRQETIANEASSSQGQLQVVEDKEQPLDDDFLDAEARNLLDSEGQIGKDGDETHYLRAPPPKSKPPEVPLLTLQVEEESETPFVQTEEKPQESSKIVEEGQDSHGKDIGTFSTVTAALFSQLNAGPPAGSTYDLKALSKDNNESTHVAPADEPDSKGYQETNKQQFRPVKESDVFELFVMDNGEQYTVYVKENGKRYYINWDTREWVRFPDRWLSEGYFQSLDNPVSSGQRRPKCVHQSGSLEEEDSRSGVFCHPTKGNLLTYMFEKKRNVACYFDESSGCWIKMPISWEKEVSYVKEMIRHIQTALPGWKDVRSIIAALRASNYDVDDCIANYVTIQDNTSLELWPGDDSAAQRTVSELQEKVQEKTAEAESLRTYTTELQQQLSSMENTITELREKLERAEVERAAVMYQQREQSKLIAAAQNAKQQQPSRPQVDQSSYIAVKTSVRLVKTNLLSVRQSVSKHFEAIRSLLKKSVTGAGKLAVVGKRVQTEVDELRNLYRKECLQRKLLYNQLQELRGNIRVFCRARPDDRYSVVLEFPTDGEVAAYTAQGNRKVFEFDKVYKPDTAQEEVFEDTVATITSCADGYNVCIIAYGQTGSGKTYTMMGPEDNPGVNIRAIKELLRICQEREQIAYTLKVSVLEVYNETLVDLLASTEQATRLQTQTKGKQVIVPVLHHLILCQFFF